MPAGALPPEVLTRWMKVVCASLSPLGTAEAVAWSSSHGILLSVPFADWGLGMPFAVLPSVACHVGPAKCFTMMSLLLASPYRSASGATNFHMASVGLVPAH